MTEIAAARWEDLRANFRWNIPEFYNIGVDVCDRWAAVEPNRRALTVVAEDGSARDVAFAELRDLSNRIANLLVEAGVTRGDRVGVLLAQSLETAASHVAVYKMGAIAVPLFALFGPDALAWRISDAGIRVLVTDAGGAAKLASLPAEIRAPLTVFSVDGADEATGALDLPGRLAAVSREFTPVATLADDPALIIYTSGTTGSPKGALHAHRVLLGHLPGVEMSHDFFPHGDDVIWTPADWAWIGGLLDVLLPALHHGVPVITRRFEKFTGEAAYELMSRFAVTNVFLPPTALKMMRATPHDPTRHPLALRTVASGGETLGAELLDWGRRVLGVAINEFYGQTEANMIVSSSAAIMTPRPGLMGRPVPGHDVAVLRADGGLAATHEIGDIAVRAGDPVMFLGYWNNPAATAAKFRGDWLVTGDQGVDEGDGWLRFVGRDDDVITSAGYRIGPGPIEDCLIRHPAVRAAAVIGKPDPQRTEVVAAFVVLRDGVRADASLEADLRDHVRTRLAAHEFPRVIRFVEELPTTTTGKIIRRALRDRAIAEDAGG